MLTSLFKLPNNDAGSGLVYVYRASLIGPAHRFELTDDGLAWQIGRRSGVWAYADIASVRLSYRPMGMQHNRYLAELRHSNGQRLRFFSASKQTVALMKPQPGYVPFIVNLHRRLAAAGSTAVLCAGVRPVTYKAIVAALVLFGLAMAALLLRALFIGEFAGAAFILGFSALVGWQIGAFLRRNRPRGYTFDRMPDDLLVT
ncbi:hypothetical protein [Rhodopseudomonas boonkerdii]|uniref:hypothetical protein n=1 Tax=Rhodopseudomonas boonkerdii TaxID=475937 RepID=UPI001E2A2614|nr:hypothetical protein [Rhodopseudomonas boonkerdii]